MLKNIRKTARTTVFFLIALNATFGTLILKSSIIDHYFPKWASTIIAIPISFTIAYTFTKITLHKEKKICL